MLSRRKNTHETISDKGLEQFPTLVAEHWLVEDFIEEESKVQRHRLSVSLAWTRILVAVVALLYFFIAKPAVLENKIVMVMLSCYVILVYVLKRLTNERRDRIYRYNFIISTLEIFLLAYLIFLAKDQVPLSFFFLSITLSAMLLPLWRLLLLVAIVALIICFQWLGITFEVVKVLLSDSVDAVAVLQLVFVSEKGSVLITLLVGLLALALIVNRLASWSFKNDVKARFRHKQMRQVLSFNRSVIEHLRSGVIVVTGNGKILSINRRAVTLLNIQTTKALTQLSELSKEIQKRYQNWLSAGLSTQDPYSHNNIAEDVFVNFDNFGEDSQHNIVMITLESVNEAMQQTQDAKLTALGRLTAGVAHEIRNPLSAINSAAQLLVETSQQPPHQKLSQVILKNVKRTDQIITDILGLFRDTKADRELLSLQQTIKRYGKEFLDVHQNGNFKLRVVGQESEELFFFFDPGQLEQILWNLLQNAIKYAGVENLQLTIRYSLSETRKLIYIDIIDNGKGINIEEVAQIFEPFFSGGKGSGLGLYLVRELCSANNANINYLPVWAKDDDDESNDIIGEKAERKIAGACFRIATQAYFSKNLKPKIR